MHVNEQFTPIISLKQGFRCKQALHKGFACIMSNLMLFTPLIEQNRGFGVSSPINKLLHLDLV